MSEQETELLVFEDQDGNQVHFQIVETTTIMGIEYLMVQDVTEDEDEVAQTYIMRKVRDDASDLYYEFVDDEEELDSVMKVFEELLEDVEFL